jgi:hypothetical protein
MSQIQRNDRCRRGVSAPERSGRAEKPAGVQTTSIGMEVGARPNIAVEEIEIYRLAVMQQIATEHVFA